MHGRQAVYSTGSSEATGTWKLGDRLTGDREVWRRATRPDALYLSTAVSLNSEQLKPVFDWFREKLHVVTHWRPVFSLNLVREGRQIRSYPFPARGRFGHIGPEGGREGVPTGHAS